MLPTVRIFDLSRLTWIFDPTHPLRLPPHNTTILPYNLVTMASQIPPLLESYLALPPETSQLVLTGILGASTNWLVLRFLYSFLKQHPAGAINRSQDDVVGAESGENVKIVFVSFMRDYTFWKDGAGRLVR